MQTRRHSTSCFYFQVQATCQELTKLGHEAFSYRVDCSKKEEIFKAAEQVREEVGNISVLVNNAGTASFKMVMDMNDGDVERTFAVNTLCHFWVRDEVCDLILNHVLVCIGLVHSLCTLS